MTVKAADIEAVRDSPARLDATDPVAGAKAPWWRRAAALGIDLLPGAAVATAAVLVSLAVPLRGAGWWVCVLLGGAAVLATAANRVLLPAVTGWSVGRAVTGLAVQRPDGTLAGPVRLLLRDLAHLLDSLSVFVGWLWPVADERGRTFADLLAGTEVHRMAAERRPRNASSLTVGVFGTAALLCVVVAALGQLLVYQRDRGIDTARTQIAAQGPKIVEQMLSYQPESLPDDFARAQSLATDGYREQLAEQQQHVLEQGGKPVPNAYRVVNSSVLSDPAPTPNRVAMLLFMQGQRGDQGKERFISATVRVTFAKVGAQWRVDSLTPVTKAVAVEDGK